MKTNRSNQRRHALTLLEVLVVIAVLAVLAAMFLPANSGNHRKSLAMRIICVNNLKQIGLAYRVWEGDHGDKYPMQTSVTNGGVMELANSSNAWINFLVMSNELSIPKILICPADAGKMATLNFTTDFNNGNISYFVGLDANETYPQTLLSGDDNFEISGVPVKSGLLEITANTSIAWTTARHHRSGNLLLADGSVQQTSNSGLTNLLPQINAPTNRLVIP